MPKSLRAPAQIVQCPYCNHRGSTRGLFAHVRLAHPNISEKPPISKREHPYRTTKVIEFKETDKGKGIFIKYTGLNDKWNEIVIDKTIATKIGFIIVDWLKKNHFRESGKNLNTKLQEKIGIAKAINKSDQRMTTLTPDHHPSPHLTIIE